MVLAPGARYHSAMAGLGARALTGFKWAGLSAAANVLFQLAFTAALARLLTPSDFGLMAMAMVALRLFTYFSQLGMGAAIVQKEQLDDQDVRCALGLTWLVCLAAAAGVALSAPLFGAFFRDPSVVPLVRVLAPNLVLVGLGQVSISLLRRRLRYGAAAIVESASYAVGYGAIGVLLAWWGFGVWALVLTTFTQSALLFLGAWALTRHPLVPSLRGDRGALLGYGTRYSLVTFLEFVGANLDAALVGRLLGGIVLGVYNRAAMLTHQTVVHAGGVMVRVLFPLLAAVQRDERKTGGVLLLGVSVIGVLGAAVSLGLSGAAPQVVRVLLGPQWGEVAPVVRVLALATPLLLVAQVCSTVCDALALLRFKIATQTLHLAALGALLLGSYLAGAGVQGAAWAVVGAEVLRSSLYLGYLSRRLRCAPGDVGRALVGVAITGALAWAACRLASAGAERWALAPVPALALALAAGLAALAAGALATLRLLDGTAQARFADESVPGWRRLRTRIGIASAGA
jgi:O-antigen/teichoic acid export membrane protein